MSLTANFDYCIELGIEQVKTIFHLAFKEEDRFPHNVPATFSASGHQFNVIVNVVDDGDRPADLSFQDDKHILFDFPIDINVAVPDAPDPTLSSITIHAKVAVPGKLDNWQEQDKDVLGPSFYDV